MIVRLNISSWFAPSEEGARGEELGVFVVEATPSEEAISLDDIGVGCGDWDNGLIVRLLSWCIISAMFINALFVDLCAPGNNELCLLCNKCTISSAV